MTDLVLIGPRSPSARGLLEYNPFYLLSALCMLGGLLALNNSLDYSPLPGYRLLWLILILNIYEAALIGLGIFLARRKLWRDAGTLFVLEAFFLVDTGFLNAEIFAFDYQIGMGVNAALFVLAAIKVGAIFAGLGLSITDPRYSLIMVQMMLLSAIPGVFKQIADSNNGMLPILAMYAVWWIVGLLPVVHLLLLYGMQSFPHRGIVGTFVLLPAISIIAHMGTSHWVYHVPWHHANLSPLLLGLAIATGASDRRVRSLTARMRLQLLLPMGALLLALPTRGMLTFHVDEMLMSPLRATFAASMLIYMHGLLIHRHIYFAMGFAACLAACGLGESPAAMISNGRSFMASLWRMVPRTMGQWGIVSVVASFVLLLIGGVVSLAKPMQRAVEEPVWNDAN